MKVYIMRDVVDFNIRKMFYISYAHIHYTQIKQHTQHT